VVLSRGEDIHRAEPRRETDAEAERTIASPSAPKLANVAEGTLLVIDEDRQPVEGAVVWSAELEYLGETGESGVVEVDPGTRLFAWIDTRSTHLITTPLSQPLVLREGCVLNGRVADVDGKPVPGVHVGLYKGDSETPWSTSTDKDGKYRIVGALPGFEMTPAIYAWHEANLAELQPTEPVTWTARPQELRRDFVFRRPVGRIVKYRVHPLDEHSDTVEIRFVDTIAYRCHDYGLISVLVTPGSGPLLFADEGGLSAAVDMQPNSGPDVRDIHMEETILARFRLLTLDGQALPGSDWTVAAEIPRLHLYEFGWSDEDEDPPDVHLLHLLAPRALLAMRGVDVHLQVTQALYGFCGTGQSYLETPDVVIPADRFLQGGTVDITVPITLRPVFQLVDTEGKVLAGVALRLEGASDGVFRARTDAAGLARFARLPATTSYVCLEAEGDYWCSYDYRGGLRGPQPTRCVAARARLITFRTGLPAETSVEFVAYHQTLWVNIDTKVSADGSVQVRIPEQITSVTARISRQRVEVPLPPGSDTVDVPFVPSKVLRIRAKGLSDSEDAEIYVADRVTGEFIAVDSSVWKGNRFADVPARRCIIAVSDYNEHAGMVEWDGVAEEVEITVKKRERRKVSMRFVDEVGSPVANTEIMFELGSFTWDEQFKWETDARGVADVWIYAGPCAVSFVHAADEPLYSGGLSFWAGKDADVLVRMTFLQYVYVEFPDEVAARALQGRIFWRAGGPWQPFDFDYLGKRKELTLDLQLGTKPATIEVRVGSHEFAFEYPGRPVEPPRFKVPAR